MKTMSLLSLIPLLSTVREAAADVAVPTATAIGATGGMSISLPPQFAMLVWGTVVVALAVCGVWLYVLVHRQNAGKMAKARPVAKPVLPALEAAHAATNG